MPANVLDETLRTRVELLGAGAYAGQVGMLVRALGLYDQALADSERRSLGLAAGAGAVGLALVAGIARAAQEAGKVERFQVAFEAVSGGAADAKAQVDDLSTSLAARRFGVETVLGAALDLERMGASATDAQAEVTGLANAVAAGAGNQAEFLRSLDAVDRMLQEHRVSFRELNMMVRAGVPVFTILKNELGLTAQQLRHMELTGAAADRVVQALIRGANKEFAGAIERDLKTLPGAVDAFGNSWKRTEALLGKQFADPFAGVVGSAERLLTAFNTADPMIQRMVGTVGVGLAAALGIYSIKTISAVTQTAHLAAENVRLENAAAKAAGAEGKAAGAADTQAGAERTLAGQLGSTGRASVRLMDVTLALAKAHRTAGDAAIYQAERERGIGGIGAGIPVTRGRPTGAAARAVREAEERAAAAEAEARRWPGRDPKTGRFTTRPPAELSAPAATPAVEAAEIAGAGAVGAEMIRRGRRPRISGLRQPVGEARGEFSAAELAAGHAAMDAEKAAGAAETAVKGAGFMAKAGKAAGAAGIAAFIADLGLQFLPDKGTAGEVKRVGGGAAGGAAAGAGMGALAGALVPVLGETGISELAGLVIGGIIGGAQGLQADKEFRAAGEAPPEEKKGAPLSKDPVMRLIELTEEQNALLGTFTSGDKSATLPVDPNIISVTRQMEALRSLANSRALR